MTPMSISTVARVLKTDIMGYVDMNTLMDMTVASFGQGKRQEFLTPDKRIDGDSAALVWFYAFLLDAAAHDKNYPADKDDCGEEWNKALKWKKFISGKYVHDVSRLCSEAAEAMGCLKADICGNALFAVVREEGCSLTELFEAIHQTEDSLKAG